jgi:Leucine-rich repeat (LRR) protein
MTNQQCYIILMEALSSAERGNRKAHRRMELCGKQRAPALDPSDLGIKQVPGELAAFTWLTRLDLKGNRLTEVPEFIGNMRELTLS